MKHLRSKIFVEINFESFENQNGVKIVEVFLKVHISIVPSQIFFRPSPPAMRKRLHCTRHVTAQLVALTVTAVLLSVDMAAAQMNNVGSEGLGGYQGAMTR